MVQELKMIKVRDETHTKLNNLGRRGETFDQIINRLMEFYEGELET